MNLLQSITIAGLLGIGRPQNNVGFQNNMAIPQGGYSVDAQRAVAQQTNFNNMDQIQKLLKQYWWVLVAAYLLLGKKRIF
jgi:hypothetical protein